MSFQANIKCEQGIDQKALEQQLSRALSRYNLSPQELIFLFSLKKDQWIIGIKKCFDRKIHSLGVNTSAELPGNVKKVLAGILKEANFISKVEQVTFNNLRSSGQFNSVDEAFLHLQKNMSATRLFEKNIYSLFGGQPKRAPADKERPTNMVPRGKLH